LLIFYSGMKGSLKKLNMIKSINASLENEDVLFALPLETYIVLLKFLLRAFA